MKKKGAERKFEEIMAKTSQMWWKTLFGISKKLNELQVVWTQRDAHGHITNCQKTKTKKESGKQEKQPIIDKGSSVRLTVDFSLKAMEVGWQWSDIQ